MVSLEEGGSGTDGVGFDLDSSDGLGGLPSLGRDTGLARLSG